MAGLMRMFVLRFRLWTTKQIQGYRKGKSLKVGHARNLFNFEHSV